MPTMTSRMIAQPTPMALRVPEKVSVRLGSCCDPLEAHIHLFSSSQFFVSSTGPPDTTVTLLVLMLLESTVAPASLSATAVLFAVSELSPPTDGVEVGVGDRAEAAQLGALCCVCVSAAVSSRVLSDPCVLSSLVSFGSSPREGTSAALRGASDRRTTYDTGRSTLTSSASP